MKVVTNPNPVQLYFEIAGNQIDGARDYQEDAFLTTYLDDVDGGSNSSALVVMADGMGGHAAGNIASNLVVSTFNKMFTGEFGKHDISSILRASLEKANGALRESIKETPALDGMGCTMVTATLTQGKVWWVNVGDSHLYLIRDRELIKKNEDHSYGGYLDRMQAQGMDIEPEPGLSRNMLMSAMTGDDVAEIDCPDQPLILRTGDSLVIASDGLDTLIEGAILQFSAWASSAKECVDALLKAVEDVAKPRQDSTTVIVVDVLERGGLPLTRRPERASQSQPIGKVENPQHEVVLSPFSVSKFEVTYAEYQRFTVATGRSSAKNPGAIDPDTHPVRFVSWKDVLGYSTWLSEQTGEKYRLLSEAEWENIARANTLTACWWGDDAGSENAHCADCKSGFDARLPTKAGRFQPNAFGLHNTAGNVQEWVHDCYKGNYVDAPWNGDVWEHGECIYRVTRRGSYDSPASSLRSSSRNKRRPTTGYDAVGIRLARDLEF